MNVYDRLNTSMCVPGHFAMGAALAEHHANNLKVIYGTCKAHVVKLQCTGNGKTSGFFNGFFYDDDDDNGYVLTAGHICGFNGADTYTAVFSKGTSQEATHQLGLLHVGTFVCDTTTNNTPVKVFEPDLAVFKCPFVPPHPPRPFATPVSPGDSVCVVGFRGVDEPQLSISDGIVSYSNMDTMHITAHADDAYSGSPVLSSEGYIVGMVKAGLGTSIKQVEVVPAQVIHAFLKSKGLPGLKG
mmetsp:Transcript_6140/g.15262  ORF Transcript_6140/g.15262 Transcript_6140/m.15262 type:complete len:242 (-) Transcript_6140:587-1312(-)|eukprot:CAMPEP_0202885694 /NCGR_PEP_ID=MMETSP1391-20130828/41794_1 /ASSEMBLY_ACC=CAM_ASM_000867 /TAXON_ID=1034604 /ORGANISM="Chlamydomonas leiostraca, Strain SAG 11-49" /LENGTH=241 /DNA_ID=CAMNT_0049568949 /DNA_START=122 /DNA_END=847 /DNA_ORIENTATION=+